jgi:predicted nucleotidyltransferase
MKTDFGLRHGDLEMICRILEKQPMIEQALIFGSRAKGNYRPGSDVDIALKGKKLSSQIVTDISFQLNEETPLPYKFDILHYHTIQEPALTAHIDRVGIVFYEKATLPDTFLQE